MNVAVEAPTRTKDPFKIFMRLLYAVSLAVYVYFLVDGVQFYEVPLQERPYHESYRELRPAGFRGQGFGILGSAMMLFMLLYSVRKRTRWLGNWGSLSRWLDVHIYFGIMGPLFVILHTSFKVSGLIAVSFWSMIAVATSGVLGRYLYLQIPRNQRGGELSLQEISEIDTHFNEELRDTLNLSSDQLKRLDELIRERVQQHKGFIRTSLSMILDDLFHFFRIRSLKKQFARELSLTEPYLYRAVQLAWRKIKLQRRMLLLNKIQQLFHYWHVFHKPFAIIMYLIMFVHVGIAVWLGYTWIF